jgi:uncharacterized membrane protein
MGPTKQEIAVSKSIVVSFPDETKIHEGIRALKKMQADGNFKIYASAAVAKDSGGKLAVQEITHEGLGVTAVGALIGGLAGLPGGPLAMMIAAAGGAIIGGSAKLVNQRADGEFTNRISRELAPGQSAIVADVDEDGVTAFEAEMEAIGGVVVRQ